MTSVSTNSKKNYKILTNDTKNKNTDIWQQKLTTLNLTIKEKQLYTV